MHHDNFTWINFIGVLIMITAIGTKTMLLGYIGCIIAGWREGYKPSGVQLVFGWGLIVTALVIATIISELDTINFALSFIPYIIGHTITGFMFFSKEGTCHFSYFDPK
ncbi:hypothetical protein H0A36_16235 [Endozoicomonas sp. SM1973]|uniref:Uncharacterized protein n=1 Tax=Spartinivicinus marinus TaxID=2994442 RepID=A0A853I794_9GAMM|nr:hypothetical protein [Spartinivicinus marinus]MCX4029767.1 hypothetical protein [Spartinivicinus marinus]NYZ67562.1 hypothetical protein [Spartinivicinus marinus]